jgi:hypothetical protein
MPSFEEDLRRLRKKHLDKEGIITLAVLVALICGIGGFIMHRHHQDSVRAAQELQADKTRFAAMEKDMAAGYAAMTAGLEKPLTEQKDAKICDHTSQKFSKGDLYCSISYGFAYKVADYDAARDRLAVLVKKLGTSDKLQPDMNQLDSTLADKQSTGYQQEIGVDIPVKTSNNFTCKLYLQVDKSSANTSDEENTGKLASYAFSCLSNVSHPIYPLAQ